MKHAKSICGYRLAGEAIGGVQLSRPSMVPGGSAKQLLVSYQPAWDEAAEVIGVSIAVVDMTEHVRVEASSRDDAFGRIQVSVGTSAVPWMMDAEGSDLHGDASWRPDSHAVDRSPILEWMAYVHPEDLEEVARTVKLALLSGNPIDIEYRVKAAEGGWEKVRSCGSARFGPMGELTRWYGHVSKMSSHADREDGLQVTAEANSSLLKTPVTMLI